MEQRSRNAAVRDALIEFRKEEYALGMEQRSRSSYAALRDARIKPIVVESVGDKGQSALLMTNLQLLDQSTKRLPLLIYHTRALVMH